MNSAVIRSALRGVIAILLAACMLLLASCASMGTKTRVLTPEALSSIEEVAVWPVTAIPLESRVVDAFAEMTDSLFEIDPSFRTETVYMGLYAEDLLVAELTRAKLFTLVEPDSVVAAISPSDSLDFRLGRHDWREIVNMDGTQYLLVTDLRFKTGAHGANSYISLSVFDWRTKELVVEARFNTMWGKSYGAAPGVGKTLPDAVEGAVKALAKVWREHTGSN